MRRGATVLVVVAVSAIALAAGWDALRGGDEPAAQPEAQPTGSTEEDEGTNYVPLIENNDPDTLRGVLYYTNEDCRLSAAELPDIRPIRAPNWDDCRFTLSPDATRVGEETTAWDPHSDPRRGRLFRVEGDTIQIATNAGPEGEPIRGTAPAWRPDGTLTYFAGGEIRDWPEGRTVVPANRLRMVVTEHPNAPGSVELLRNLRVVEHHWLDQDRLVAQIHADVRDGPPLDLVAVFDDGLPFASTDFLGEVRELWASPFGTYYAVLTDTLGLYDFNGNLLQAPQLEGARAVAWSPDEDRMAVATDASVHVFTPGAADPVERLELVANDLDWRADPELETMGGAEQARDFLESMDVSGRLFVTLPGCTLRALEMPDLAWSARTLPVSSPCRFNLDGNEQPLTENEKPEPGGDRVASCSADTVRVEDPDGTGLEIPGPCAPGWMPDGTLTFIRDGELYRLDGETPRLLISGEELRERLGRPSALEEVAWVTDRQLWAVVRSGDTATLALLTEGQLALSPSFTARKIEGLQVSTTGMVAARTDDGVVFFDAGGRRALTFHDGLAVAWAPDQLVAAVATPGAILFVAPISGEVVSLPLAVSDLEWVVP
jgi:hypothetical protein